VATFPSSNDLRHDDANVREAVRFGLVVAVRAVGFLFTLMLVVLTMSMPALAGPAVFGG
jgi:hypothetical protein